MAKMKRPWAENWKVLQPLGKGGMSITELVSRVSDPAERAVLKRLKHHLSDSAQQRGRMHREVAALETLAPTDAKIPAVYDHNTDKFSDLLEELFVVMEYIPGRTLQQAIEADGPMSLERAAAMTRALAKTVGIALKEGVLHRDIKPDNIILRSENPLDVVMVDYGLSFSVEDDDLTQDDETFRNKFLDLAETNTLGGNRRDSRSDITALCAVFYYCLTGKPPRHLRDDQDLPPHMRPGASVAEVLGVDIRRGQLEAFFDRGFQPRTDDRFQTVPEFFERLEHVLAVPTEEQLYNPLEVDKRNAEWFSRNDRVTQLKNFERVAVQLLQVLVKHPKERKEQLSSYQFAMVVGGTSLPELPDGYEHIGKQALRLNLSIRHHQNFSIALYCPVANGGQCVLLKHYARHRAGAAESYVGNWEPVLWYDGQSVPELKAAHLDIDKWLCSAMEELRREASTAT